MDLRPENLMALKNAGIPKESLLYLSDLTRPSSELAKLGARFALVDHNSLLPEFRRFQKRGSESGGRPGTPSSELQAENAEEDPVVAVIDHHDDEGVHQNAPTRLIQVPTGSTASLLTQVFRKSWEAALSGPAGIASCPVPPEVATLLLQAILIDTGGLKRKVSGSKTTPADVEAASFLYPVSTLAPAADVAFVGHGDIPDDLDSLTSQLIATKMNVSHLSTRYLLLRDYKEYIFDTATSTSLRVGLSTVPMNLKTWLTRDGGGWEAYMKSMDAWMEERQLDIAGVLTTYKSEGKGKSRRELLFVVRLREESRGLDGKKVFDSLANGLRTDPTLQLEDWGNKGGLGSGPGIALLNSGAEGRYGGVWNQANTAATRKQVQPAVVSIESGGRDPTNAGLADISASRPLQKEIIAGIQ
jgi:exopolyphosphatase